MNKKGTDPSGVQVPIRYWRSADGWVRAEAPDLEGCQVASSSLEEVLPMLRLAVERWISCSLAEGRGVPALVSMRDQPAAGEVNWAEIHIHLGHLAALVRHQSR